MAPSRRLPPEPSSIQEDPRFLLVVRDFAADPRFADVIAAYEHDRQAGGNKFGSKGLKVNGKLFAMVGRAGKLVVKLPKARVDELVAAQDGEYFDPGHGRQMKQWVEINRATLSWTELALEAHDFVKGLER